jgi:phosphoglycolate phosphatase
MSIALLFDLDGTLVDSARDIAGALSILSERRGGPTVTAEQVRPLVSLGAATLVARALGPWAGDAESDLAEFRTLLAALPTDPAALYDGVPALLAFYAERQYPMAIVTNKPERLARLLLEQHGLTEYFGAVVGGDTLSVAKPDPAPLYHALELLDHTGAAVMIGDSDVDASSAEAAKLPFLLHRNGYGTDEIRSRFASTSFDQFIELAALLEEAFHRGSITTNSAPTRA